MMHKLWVVLTFMFVAGVSVANPLPKKPHIYVEGSAEIEVKPDIAVFTLYLEHSGESADSAKKEVDKRSKSLVKLCRKLKIKFEDIAASGIRVNQKYTYDNNLRKNIYDGVEVSRSVEITLRDIAKYNEVMHQLVSSNLSENISSRLQLSDEKKYTDMALEKALADASERAKAIAKLQNVKLGQVHSISEFNLRQPEHYQLRVLRNVSGQSSSEFDLMSEGIGALPDIAIADSLGRVASVNQDPFNEGLMKATAQIFVVFLIE